MEGFIDRELVDAAGFTQLTSLWLDGLPITGSGLAALAGSRKLELLSICNTHVSDECLEVVSRFPSLKRVYLDGNKWVSRAGVESLANCKTIEYVSVVGCDKI